MAMNGNTLGSAIVTAVNALTSAQKADPTACWQAIAGVIVAHIQTNATVLIKTTDSGLQRDNTAGNPATLAPASTKTLPAGAIQ